MRKIFSKPVAVLSALTVLFLSSGRISYGKGARTDSEGHVLVSLWKEYDRLQGEDRPDREADVLEKIIFQAERRHLPWDFYDAWREYRDAVLSRDWKRREAVDSALVESVRKFDEPVVTYAVSTGVLYGNTDMSEIRERLKEDSSRLESSRNGMFYREGYGTVTGSVAGRLPESVINDIASDYEYILWSMFIRSRGRDAEISGMLSESLSGRYPSAPYLEYCLAAYKDRGLRQAALESFAGKYSGKAVSCYAIQDVFSLRMDDMLSGKAVSGSGDFLEFRRECGDFEKFRKSFSGSEKKIAEECTRVKGIIADLDSKDIRIESSGDTVMVLLRNIGACRMEVFSGAGAQEKPVSVSDLADSTGSYYLIDTLRVLFPDLDDGTYVIRCTAGDVSTSVDYVRNRISVAYRKGEDGIAVFAADMKSGRPLEGTQVEFFKGDSLVASFGDVAFSEGFVSLPADFVGDRENYRLLMDHSQNYKNVFDPSTGFYRGRTADGNWIEQFDPYYPYFQYMYRESNAWNNLFYPPHDIKGVLGLYPDKKTVENKLDSLFTEPWRGYEVENLTAFIGNYCHGNQPGHSIPYMYYFVGKQPKAQAILNTIMDRFYDMGAERLALAGMDDAGEMTSWYVLNAIGLYTYSPADPEYIVTVPLFDEVKFTLGNGKTFTIKKTGNGEEITGLECGGRRLKGWFVRHDDIAEGKTLQIDTK